LIDCTIPADFDYAAWSVCSGSAGLIGYE